MDQSVLQYIFGVLAIALIPQAYREPIPLVLIIKGRLGRTITFNGRFYPLVIHILFVKIPYAASSGWLLLTKKKFWSFLRRVRCLTCGMNPTRILTLLFVLFGTVLQAQFGESIRTGRPGQSIGTFALGGKTLQFQTGYNYVGKDERKDHNISTVVRHGIGERWEVSSVINYNAYVGEDVKRNGFTSLQIGGRYHVVDQSKWMPSVGIQSRIALPIDNLDYEADGVVINSVLAMGWKLTPYLSTVVNLGHGWNLEERKVFSRYTWAINVQPLDRWGLLLEMYGDSIEDPLFDFGVAYLVNKDLQLDFSFGQRPFFLSDVFFYDIGFSWRTHWRDQK